MRRLPFEDLLPGLRPLEEKAKIERQLQAARIVKEKRQNEAYRAKINQRVADYREEVYREIAELWTILPRTRWALSRLQHLEEQAVGGFDGKNFDEISGLRIGSAGRLTQALAQELRGTTLADEIGPAGTESEPKIAKPPEAESFGLPAAYVTDALGRSLGSRIIG